MQVHLGTVACWSFDILLSAHHTTPQWRQEENVTGKKSRAHCITCRRERRDVARFELSSIISIPHAAD